MNTDTTVAVAASASTSPSDERIGRFSRTDLEAMLGKRGRKPPEFYQLYPEKAKQASAPTIASDAPTAPAEPKRRRTTPDALAEQIRAASPALRKLIADLLAITQAAPVDARIATIDASEFTSTPPVRPDPVYADPEQEPVAAD